MTNDGMPDRRSRNRTFISHLVIKTFFSHYGLEISHCLRGLEISHCLRGYGRPSRSSRINCSAVGPVVTGMERSSSQFTLNRFRFICTGPNLAFGTPSLVIMISFHREASSSRFDKLSFAVRTLICSGEGGS